MTARPQSPPLLQPEILSSLTKGSSAEVTDLPPMKLNFSQPASDYIAFRNKLESNYVALENVILKDYNLAGTIKVKNIAFEKKVVVRYTTDSWESFTDVDGSFVPTSNTSGLRYDTFSFEVHISPKMDISKKFQFAVVYHVKSHQYWDNNSGDNFEVVSANWKEDVIDNHNTTDAEVYSMHHSNVWTEFCGWNKMSESVPYY
jgi:protein phosphatase 1 regulatory subunit 3A/B/C/D/E